MEKGAPAPRASPSCPSRPCPGGAGSPDLFSVPPRPVPATLLSGLEIRNLVEVRGRKNTKQCLVSSQHRQRSNGQPGLHLAAIFIQRLERGRQARKATAARKAQATVEAGKRHMAASVLQVCSIVVINRYGSTLESHKPSSVMGQSVASFFH